MIISILGLIFMGGPVLAYWMVIAGNGVVWGLYTVLIGVTWPRFFGLKNLGAISGFSLSWTVIGSALGPYMFSLSVNFTGGYNLVAWVCLAIALLLVGVALKADNPGLPQKIVPK